MGEEGYILNSGEYTLKLRTHSRRKVIVIVAPTKGKDNEPYTNKYCESYKKPYEVVWSLARLCCVC
jgi:hypothetical protein